MTQKPDDPRAFDPFSAWQAMRDAGVEAWAKMMLQLVNSEEYAQAISAMLDSYLTTSAPVRKLIEAVMVQFVSSEAYAKATRELFDTYLTTSAPLREIIQSALLQALTQVGTSSGANLTGMAERFDPTGMWRTMRDSSAEAWSRMLTAAPFQQTLETTMTQTLMQLNMPTRADITSLIERLGHLETRLDELETKLDAVQSPRLPRSAQRRSPPTDKS